MKEKIIYTEKEILLKNCKNKKHTRTGIRLVTGNRICEDCRQEKIMKHMELAFQPLKGKKL